MKIIVTGGAGFIASHIVDAYIRADHRVVVIDNLSSGFRKNLNPKAKFYRADIRNGKAIEAICKRERPDIVNHHAALVSVIESVRSPLATFETNLLGTVNVLLAFGKFRKNKGGRFIYASTGGALYGEPAHIPANEHAPIHPLSPYGLSKFLSEQAIEFYAQQSHFPFVILRYANVYGPRQNPHGEAGVVAIFTSLMKKGTQPTIFGDGSKTRDYVFVGDVTMANVLALRKGKNDAFNIGSEKETSDQNVFDAIAGDINFRKPPLYAPYRKGEVYRISLDARKAKKTLGWSAATQFNAGIKKTVSTLA